MTNVILLLGDQFLPHPVHSSSASGPVRMIVWASDLCALTNRREARKKLKKAALDSLDACRPHPACRHLLLAYRTDPPAQLQLGSIAQSLALKIHTDAELRLGRDLDVVLLDASDVDDPTLLLKRMDELSTQAGSLSGAASLSWPQIRDESIRQAATSLYL